MLNTTILFHKSHFVHCETVKLHGPECFLRSWQVLNQDIPCILWNPKVHYFMQKNLPLVHILSHMDPVHALRSRFFKKHFNMFPPMPSCTSGLFPSGFPTRILYAFLFSSIHATCLGHLIIFYFIILVIFGEEQRSSGSSICYLLQTLVTSSFCQVKMFSLVFSFKHLFSVLGECKV